MISALKSMNPHWDRYISTKKVYNLLYKVCPSLAYTVWFIACYTWVHAPRHWMSKGLKMSGMILALHTLIRYWVNHISCNFKSIFLRRIPLESCCSYIIIRCYAYSICAVRVSVEILYRHNVGYITIIYRFIYPNGTLLEHVKGWGCVYMMI